MKDVMIKPMNRLSSEGDAFPSLGCTAIYRVDEHNARQWAVLNGWQAGRWTFQFGPNCLADDHDTKGIAEAMIRDNPGVTVVHYMVAIEE